MKLRTARKIVKAVGTPDEARYTGFQIGRAQDRVERTASVRETHRFWHALMRELGVNGRVQILARTGAPGMAFDLYMRQGEKS